METKLARIAEVARAKPEEKFTSLVHLINDEMIKNCHKQMDRKKAVGVDEITKEEYEKNLEGNIKDLLARMKRQAYKPQSVKRVYIPKPGTDKKRPLGIPAYEDKLVQLSLAKILNAIYEQDFLECSFGFRPQRSGHDALKVLNVIVRVAVFSISESLLDKCCRKNHSLDSTSLKAAKWEFLLELDQVCRSNKSRARECSLSCSASQSVRMRLR